MTGQRPQMTVSAFVVLILIAAAANAADPAEPGRVLMTENALSTEQAQAAQKTWADHLGFDAVIENSIGMQLCVIPPGTFPLGWEDRTGEEGPQEVTHSQPYFIGRYEVTQGEWERVMGRRRWKPEAGAGDRFPVYTINYAEAAEFCRKLTRLEREAAKLPKRYEYRLPTDAELEYAGRAGTKTLTYFGDTVSSTQANYDGREPFKGAEKGPNLGRTAEVGSYPANAWGLHDTIGNLYELCFDWYHPLVKGGVDPVQLLPPPESLVPQRVRRGGCHSRAGRYCRSANRFYYHPEGRSSLNGFRVVLSQLHLDAFHQLADSVHTRYTRTWTRDGTNTRIWHKRDLKTRNWFVMSGPVHSLPGVNYAVRVTNKSYNTWAHACLADGRILVQSSPPNQESGYYLMTPNKNGTPEFERIQCNLAMKGVLGRIRFSPSETRLCFEFQTGFEDDNPGRTLYVADFDVKQPAIAGARPFANKDGKPVRYAFPRWTEDESAIVYQAEGKLYRYNLTSKATTLAEGDAKTDPHTIASGGITKTPVTSPPAASAVGSHEPNPVQMTERALTTEQVKVAQKSWADHLGFKEVIVENSIGMQLCVIPPRTFPMGRGKADRKSVTHSQPFLLGRYEVTQGEWERVMGSVRSVEEIGVGNQFPVYQVSHTAAAEFCRKLTQLEREADTLPDGYDYRLPTDAEWEYACRAGTLTATSFGDKLSSTQANFDGHRPHKGGAIGPNLDRLTEVGSYPANA